MTGEPRARQRRVEPLPSRRWARTGALVALAAALLLGSAGCGSSHDAAVRSVAEDFHAALAEGDGEAACTLLAPATRSELEDSAGKPCPQAIVEEQLPRPSGTGEVEVFDVNGQVRFDGDTVFLSEFSNRWRVVAAGCTRHPAQPYDCTLSGG